MRVEMTLFLVNKSAMYAARANTKFRIKTQNRTEIKETMQEEKIIPQCNNANKRTSALVPDVVEREGQRRHGLVQGKRTRQRLKVKKPRFQLIQ